MNATTGQDFDIVRGEVHRLLERSEAFANLPTDKRRDLAKDLVKVSSYLADKEWLKGTIDDEDAVEPITALKSTMMAQAPEALTAAPGAEPVGEGLAAAEDVGKRLAKAPGQVGQDFKAGAVRESVDAFESLVDAVDFPDFVSGLIQGVFQAIVDASIQQMEAYGELLSAVSKSVDQFADDNITDSAARDYVANRNPGAVRIVQGEDGRSQLAANPDAEDEVDLGRLYNVDRSVDLEDRESERALVQAAKLEMAKSRQQLMATMVLLGINRIVVTNGRINAKVVFDVKGSDKASRVAKASMLDEKENKKAVAAAAWSPWGAMGAAASSQHKTTIRSSSEDKSDSSSEVKAQLSGDVRINFRSETFPLERLATDSGIALLQERAQPVERTQAPSGQQAQGGAGR